MNMKYAAVAVLALSACAGGPETVEEAKTAKPYARIDMSFIG